MAHPPKKLPPRRQPHNSGDTGVPRSPASPTPRSRAGNPATARPAGKNTASTQPRTRPAASGLPPLPPVDRRRYRSGVNPGLLVGLGAAVLAVVGLRWALDSTQRPSAQEAPGLLPMLSAKPPEPPPFSPMMVDESQPSPAIQALVDNYVERLAAAGYDADQQGVWVQQGDRLLAQNAGKTPLAAASLTKLATTLGALDRWQPDYKFVTRVGITGPVEAGVLQGDLVIQGGGDPMFVWESAFAIGQSLNQLGIREVAGNLRVGGVFVMNFERDRPSAANLLREGLDSANWGWEAAEQYATLPPGTPQPQVTIRGQTFISPAVDPRSVQIIAEHYSLPLQELLKRMNMYSNNIMADLLADLLGGAQALEEKTTALAQVPAAEVQFINGSGLGQENQTSPRAVCRILDVIGQKLEPHSLGLKDVLPIVPVDKGTLDSRNLPQGLIGKTGTLFDVSNLAGMLPLAGQPVMSLHQPQSVCFAIQNRGAGLDFFYEQQEAVVKALMAAIAVSSESPQAQAGQAQSNRPLNDRPLNDRPLN